MAQPITLLSGNGFEVTAAPQQGSLVLKFKGSITEDTRLGELMKVLMPHLTGLKGILLDPSPIQRINSCGIREWLLFLERLSSQTSFAFLQLSELFIEQAAVIPSLLGKKGTLVLSFQAPYQCPKCSLRALRTLTPKQVAHSGGSYQPPMAACERCGGPMEFDGIEDEYFRFLNHCSPAKTA